MPTGRRQVFLATIVGVALGVFSVLADGVVRGRLIVTLGNLASPWGLAAFAVGFRATAVRAGAIGGALALIVAVATYYAGAAVRGYVFDRTVLIWTVVAAVAGPIMGASGAAVASRRSRPPIAAASAPSVLLLAEAIFFVVDRRMWRYDLQAESYRLVDVALVVAFVLGAFVLPLVLVRETARRLRVYLVVALGGVVGAVALVMLGRFVALS